MKFKETFLVGSVKWMKGVQKTALVDCMKNTQKGVQTFTFRAFEKDGEILENLKGCVIVAEIVIMTGGRGFPSEPLIRNVIKLDVAKIEKDETRIYDKNHY